LPPALTLLFCLAYSVTLKMATIYSTETVEFQRATGRYIPEDNTLEGKLTFLSFFVDTKIIRVQCA
jgi:4-hydroxybenzoate polyprenyltransferase